MGVQAALLVAPADEALQFSFRITLTLATAP